MESAATIRESQLSAIRSQVSIPACKGSNADLEALHARSTDRAAQWPDALQAVRDRKKREKQERLDAEEAAGVELDRQEEAYRQEQRQRKVHAAQAWAWEQTDDVRALRRKLLLSNVVAEREQQIVCNTERARVALEQDAAFRATQHEALQDAAARELQKEVVARTRALALRDATQQQLESFKARLLSERAQERQEAQELRRATLELEAQQRRKDEHARQQMRDRWTQTRERNAALEAARVEQRRQDCAAEATLAAYAAEREAAQLARQQAETEKAERRADQRQKMVEAMERAYAAFNTKAEAQLAHDAAAAEARSEAALAEQQQKRASDLAAINQSRRQQLAEREAGKARCRTQEHEEKAASERLAAQARALELATATEVRERRRQHAAFLLQQAAEKQTAKDALLAQQRQEHARRLGELDASRAAFHSYAEERVSEWASQGKSVLPMRKHLNAVGRHSRTVTAQ